MMEWVLRPPSLRWPARMGRARLTGLVAAVVLVVGLSAEAAGVLAHRSAVARAVDEAALAAARTVRDARTAALAVLGEAGVTASSLSVEVGGPGDTGGLELGQPVTRVDLRLVTKAPSTLLGWLPVGLAWPIETHAAAETVGQVALTLPTGFAAAPAPLRATLFRALFGLDAADSEIVAAGLAGTAVPVDDLLAILADQASPADAVSEPSTDATDAASLGLPALFTGLSARATLPRTRVAFTRLAAAVATSDRRVAAAGLVDPSLGRGGFSPSAWSVDALDLVIGVGLRASVGTPLDLVLPYGGQTVGLSLRLSDEIAASPVVRRVLLGDTLRLPRLQVGLSVGIGGALLAALPSLTLPIELDAGGGTVAPRRIDCRARAGETLAALLMAPGPVAVRFGTGDGEGAEQGVATFDGVDGLVLKAIGSRVLAAPEPQPVAFPAAAAVTRRSESVQSVAETGPALRTLLATADIRLKIAATAPEALRQTGDARVRAAAAQLLAEAGAPAAAVVDQVTGALGLDPDRLTAVILGVDCRGARLVGG